jgi:hypothetical protein
MLQCTLYSVTDYRVKCEVAAMVLFCWRLPGRRIWGSMLFSPPPPGSDHVEKAVSEAVSPFGVCHHYTAVLSDRKVV